MRPTRLATLALALLAAIALAATAADAGPRRGRAHARAPKSGQAERTVTRTGPDGTSRTSTHDSTWQRGDGQWTRDTVHTGPGGKQGTTHVEGAKTEDGHVRDVTRTGPNGKSSTTHDEVHKTDEGYTRQTTHTGPNGGVTTRDTTGSYDPETKSWSKDVTTTRPDGSTSATQVEGQRTEDGYTRQSTHTGPNGGVTTRDTTGSYDPETKSWSKDVTTTHPDGSTSTKQVEGQGSWDPETKTWTRERVVTHPDGTTSTTEVTTKVTPVTPEAPPAQ